MNNHGLSTKALKQIQNILVSNTQAIEQVALFGSRANGTYNNYSDIDIVLYGNIEPQIADRLWTCFSESLLPYKVDISLYQHLNYLPLKRHIDGKAKTLFTKTQLYSKQGGSDERG